MDEIDGDLVERLARQASLAIDGGEREELASRLNCMLGMLKPILELGNSQAEPVFCGVLHAAPWREDEITPSLPLEKVFQNASTRDRDYFKVPRITNLEE